MIRAHLRGEVELPPLAFQCLQLVNRIEVLERLRQSTGQLGHHLVLDRYWASGVVYGGLDGLDVEWLKQIHSSLPKADLSVLLDVRPEVLIERIDLRGGDLERYDGHVRELREGYRKLWEKEFTEPKPYHKLCPFGIVVNADQSVPHIVNEILGSAFTIYNNLSKG